ncbi:24132_t:CDS:2, partial [Racocetra persica]
KVEQRVQAVDPLSGTEQIRASHLLSVFGIVGVGRYINKNKRGGQRHQVVKNLEP